VRALRRRSVASTRDTIQIDVDDRLRALETGPVAA
jgi:hypothetical protein